MAGQGALPARVHATEGSLATTIESRQNRALNWGDAHTISVQLSWMNLYNL